MGAAALAQSETRNPQPAFDGAEWVTVDEAARLTRQSVRTWQLRAERAFHDSLARKAPPCSGKGKPVWWVHRSLDKRLTRYPARPTREDRARASLLAKYPQHQVDLAYCKAHWLRAWLQACERGRETRRELAERIAADARGVEGDDFAIGYRTLQAWQRAYYSPGPGGQIRGVEALVDRRAAPNRIDDSEGAEPIAAGREPAAVEYFYELYHTENKQSVAVCHEVTLHEAKHQGWTWPASYSATRKWLATYDNLSISFLLRYGRDAWCRRFMGHIEINYTLIDPGQMMQTDHHQCDFWVDHEGTQLRPWLTVLQDMRSRMIVGWNLGPAPHTDAIISTYLQAFQDFAIPEVLRIDNGKDFASELLTGVTKATRDRLRREHGPDWQQVLKRDESLVDCVDTRFLGIAAELGIETGFAVPYAPWSKGTTERWFGSFEGRAGKTFTTACGNSPDSRPECLEAIRSKGDIPTMDEARKAIADYIVEYHHRAHSGDGMDGRSPLEVWHTATRLRRAGAEELLFLMQARGVYKVGKNGVAFKVGGVRLTYGAGQPALYRCAGREVFITLDPHDLSCCYAFTADRNNRRFIGRLEANKRISPMATVEDLRDANKAVGHKRKIMHQAGRQSAGRTRSAVDELRAKGRERVAKLRATGTDDRVSDATIVPVRTGFEGCSKTARTASAGPKTDRKARDLSTAQAALGFGLGLSPKEPDRARASDDLLRGLPIEQTEAVKDDGETDEGMDAGTQPTDAFSLIAGADRHGPRRENK